MLTHLRVRNFQSLADVELELAPFTVIVGPSNHGKSAIRRAIESVVDNAPATGRLRTGADTITVELTTGTGAKVAWEKGSKRNAYVLLGADGTTVVQDKPGASATPEVTAMLGLDGLNFADQFDPPYLLTETPSAAAKALGELTNITVLYDGIREATRRQRSHQGTAKTLTAQLDTATTELATYGHLPAEGQRLEAAATALGAAKEAERSWAVLNLAATDAANLVARIAQADDVLAGLPDPTAALLAISHAERAIADYEAIGAAEAIACERAAYVRSWSDLPPLPELPADLEAAVTTAETLATAVIQADAYRRHVERCQSEALAQEGTETNAQQALAAIDACPMCGATTGHLELA